MSRSPLHLLVAIGLAAGFLVGPGVAWGSDIDISPVRVHISAERRNATLSLTHRGAQPLRYQVTAHAWTQSPDGEMTLSPTEDLVFFPSLLELAHGETRQIRIAAQGSPRATEQAYRLLLSPLPDAASSASGTVRVVTRFSIPVFVEPRAPAPEPTAAVRMENGDLIVSVFNRGNAHFMSRTVRVVGNGRSGTTLVERSLPAWYVLARGRRVYRIPLAAETCSALTHVGASVTTEGTSARAATDVDPSRCGP